MQWGKSLRSNAFTMLTKNGPATQREMFGLALEVV